MSSWGLFQVMVNPFDRVTSSSGSMLSGGTTITAAEREREREILTGVKTQRVRRHFVHICVGH